MGGWVGGWGEHRREQAGRCTARLPIQPPPHAHLQVGVDAAQVVLLQLEADVLCDEVDGHHVVSPAHTRARAERGGVPAGGAPRQGAGGQLEALALAARLATAGPA